MDQFKGYYLGTGKDRADIKRPGHKFCLLTLLLSWECYLIPLSFNFCHLQTGGNVRLVSDKNTYFPLTSPQPPHFYEDFSADPNQYLTVRILPSCVLLVLPQL